MAPPSEDDPLVVGSHFNYRNRPRRDGIWGILYMILMALTLVGGIYGIVHRCEHRLGSLNIFIQGSCCCVQAVFAA